MFRDGHPQRALRLVAEVAKPRHEHRHLLKILVEVAVDPEAEVRGAGEARPVVHGRHFLADVPFKVPELDVLVAQLAEFRPTAAKVLVLREPTVRQREIAVVAGLGAKATLLLLRERYTNFSQNLAIDVDARHRPRVPPDISSLWKYRSPCSRLPRGKS